MKLQYIGIVFIIIMLPIFLVTSYFIQQQINTINLQTSHNRMLIDATREAMQAFEINTVVWESRFTAVEGSRRRHVTASVNTFLDGLTNRVGTRGMSRRAIEQYVPAIAFIAYDGFYIYAPTNVPMQNIDTEDGVGMVDELPADIGMGYRYDQIRVGGQNTTVRVPGIQELLERTEFRHVLRPVMRYSARYIRGPLSNPDIDVTVNYTLDNYVSIYGRLSSNGPWISRAGFLVEAYRIDTSVIGEVTIDNNISITGEILTERIAYFEEAGQGPPNIPEMPYQYVHDIDGHKIYFERNHSDQNHPSNRFFELGFNHTKEYLAPIRIERHDIYNALFHDANRPFVQIPGARLIFTRLSIPDGDYGYRTIYRLLNPTHAASNGGNLRRQMV
ncbi:MAG: hypothetical protein FWC68_04940 [Oscillospiraceae bacterium]|nr:hypothetical protein [Oscillospiraceae bacterium]